MTNEQIVNHKRPVKRGVALVVTALVALLLLALGACSLIPSNLGGGSNSGAQVKIGALVPEIDLPALNGERVTLSKLHGRPVLVNFWATWCGPCREEFPAFVRKYKQYQDQGFVIIGVNTDDTNTDEGVMSFVNNTLVKFPIVRDQDDKLAKQFNLRGLPTSVFIDRQGIVRDIVVGGPMKDEFIDLKFTQINQP